MRDAFGWNLEQHILHGGYPGAAPLIQDPERLTSYIRDAIVEPTISRDILSLTDVRRPALLRRLFELACSHCAEILSYNKMLGQMQDASNVTTLVHYLTLLGDAGMVQGLQKYGGEVRRRSSSPKLQPLDTGLVTASSSASLTAWTEEPSRWGRLAECAVGTHLCNWAFSSGRHDVYYWNERSREVDFVVPYQDRLFAIEVKGGRLRPLHGMEKFMQSHPAAVPLAGGRRRHTHGGLSIPAPNHLVRNLKFNV